MQIKIITLNIWDLPFWFVKDRRSRIVRIAEYLEKSDAHIVCLQESFDVTDRAFLRAKLNKYQVAGNVDDHRRILFVKFFDVNGGLIVFSKFPVLQSRFVPYSRFLNSAITEALGRKGFLEVVVKTPFGNMKVINTHMHHETAFFDRKIRLLQTTKMIMKTNGDGLPTIVAGDFNENYLMKEDEFTELFKTTGFSTPLKLKDGEKMQPTYRPNNVYVDNWWNKIRFPKRYDYILIKNIKKAGLRVARYEPDYVNPPLSDHDPLVLILSA